MAMQFKQLAFCTVSASMLLIGQNAVAHTRLQTPTVMEGNGMYNAAAIGHGCKDPKGSKVNVRVVANSLVFPDGTDSTVHNSDGSLIDGATVDQYINWTGISHVASRDVFNQTAIEWGRSGLEGNNPVGNHSWNGNLAGNGTIGLVPFRIKTATIIPESCAKTVTLQVAIVDICQITRKSQFKDYFVNMWTPAVGSNFDGPGLHGYNSPATFKVTRDLANNPLPSECGTGIDVIVKPSADQLNHDLPIPNKWPLKGN